MGASRCLFRLELLGWREDDAWAFLAMALVRPSELRGMGRVRLAVRCRPESRPCLDIKKLPLSKTRLAGGSRSKSTQKK